MNRPFLCFVLTNARLGIILIGCKEEEAKLASRWKNTAFVIDGDAAEWSGTLTYLEKGKFAFGAQNDASK